MRRNPCFMFLINDELAWLNLNQVETSLCVNIWRFSCSDSNFWNFVMLMNFDEIWPLIYCAFELVPDIHLVYYMVVQFWTWKSGCQGPKLKFLYAVWASISSHRMDVQWKQCTECITVLQNLQNNGCPTTFTFTCNILHIFAGIARIAS